MALLARLLFPALMASLALAGPAIGPAALDKLFADASEQHSDALFVYRIKNKGRANRIIYLAIYRSIECRRKFRFCYRPFE